MALSMPFTTLPIEFVTDRIVTAVSTRLATASIREASRRRLSPSFFFRIAFWAYIRAPSWFPFCSACTVSPCSEDRGSPFEPAHLLQLVLLCDLVLVGFLCLALERLCRELAD